MTEPTLTLDQRVEGLVKIAKDVRTCSLCGLATAGRQNPVPGAGPTNAQIMFIGEGPGANEDQQGLPFVGPSGRLLEEWLASIGMNRKQVFIANVVKCRPPENRDPLPDEVSTCTKTYLYRQIELVNPKVIATLGRFSMGLFFPSAKISVIHGRPKFEKGRFFLPLYHPAAVLRTASLRPEALNDFHRILDLLAEYDQKHAAATPIPPPTPPTPPDSVANESDSPLGQLPLF